MADVELVQRGSVADRWSENGELDHAGSHAHYLFFVESVHDGYDVKRGVYTPLQNGIIGRLVFVC